jgi:hypothetical protein
VPPPPPPLLLLLLLLSTALDWPMPKHFIVSAAQWSSARAPSQLCWLFVCDAPQHAVFGGSRQVLAAVMALGACSRQPMQEGHRPPVVVVVLLLLLLLFRFFGDWLNWLCSGWNQTQAQAVMERTLQEICKELQAAGVRGRASLDMCLCCAVPC